VFLGTQADAAKPIPMTSAMPVSVFYHGPEEGDDFVDQSNLDDDDEEDEEDEFEETEDTSVPLLSRFRRQAAVNGMLQAFGVSRPANASQEDNDELAYRVKHCGQDAQSSMTDDRAHADTISDTQRSNLASSRGKTFQDGTLTGIFQKRSPWWVEGWRARTYVFRDGKLLYFDPNFPDKPLGVLNMALVRFELHCFWKDVDDQDAEKVEETTQVPQSQEDEASLKRSCECCDTSAPASWCTFYLKPMLFPKKVFAFRGPQSEIRELTARVAEALDAKASPSNNDIKSLNREKMVVSLKNFWRFPFLTEAEFTRRACSGDIILFRGKDKRAKLQRAATGSLYDHVGLLLRNSNGELVILEALGMTGVSYLRWSVFMARRWHTCYDWIAVRRVYFQRSPKQIASLQSYVRSVLGHKYGLTVKKLLSRELSDEFDENGDCLSSADPAKAQSANDTAEDGRTFFCSELVAACLKRCGVIAGNKSSTCYWPGSFSQSCSERLPLQEHARIGEEQLIVFSDLTSK